MGVLILINKIVSIHLNHYNKKNPTKKVIVIIVVSEIKKKAIDRIVNKNN